MSRLFIVLLRILFPLDLVARSREIMRAYFQQITGWLADPDIIASFEEHAEDRAILESHIVSAEEHFNLLVHERAREMLGLAFVYVRRQRRPQLRKAKSLQQLSQRLTQIARNFHNLEKLAARCADRMQRERDSDPLRLAATHRSTSPTLRVVEAKRRRLASTSAQHWGRWHARPCAHHGGGAAVSARGPPHSHRPIPIP